MRADKVISGGMRLFRTSFYRAIDSLYLYLDRKTIHRSRNIRMIPREGDRRGGKHSYAEWAHVIGIFQTLMYLCLDGRENVSILDVGCGTGLLGIAGEPFLGSTGRYVGIDVMRRDVEFCRRHFPGDRFGFIHLGVSNPVYAPFQESTRLPWPVESASFDLVTALSVWTHLGEDDAIFYLKEVNRVLKPGGKALITFFLLDEIYEESLSARSARKGRHHCTLQDRWIFDQAAYGSDAWFHPKWTKHPEGAIAITRQGLRRLLAESGLELVQKHQGNWKEVLGIYFQDVVIFSKP